MVNIIPQGINDSSGQGSTLGTNDVCLISSGKITSPGTGLSSEQYGSNAQANGTSTLAVGNTAIAAFADSVSLGVPSGAFQNTARGVASGAGRFPAIAIGIASQAGPLPAAVIAPGTRISDCIAIGDFAEAGIGAGPQSDCIAIGDGSIAGGSNSSDTNTYFDCIAVGDGSQAGGGGFNSGGLIAMGNGSSAQGGFSCVAIGGNGALVGSSITDHDCVGIGDTEAYGAGAIAIGDVHTSAGTRNSTQTANIAIGFTATAANAGSGGTQVGNIAIGQTVNVGAASGTDSNNIGIGQSITSQDGDSIAIGHTVSATGAASIAIGGNSTANNSNVAIGQNALANNVQNTAVGNGAQAIAQWCTAYGNTALALTKGGTVVGTGASGNNGGGASFGFMTALGAFCTAGLLSGVTATANIGDCIAIGDAAAAGTGAGSAHISDCIAIGDGLIAGPGSPSDTNTWTDCIAIGDGCSVGDNNRGAADMIGIGDGTAVNGDHDCIGIGDGPTAGQVAGDHDIIAIGNGPIGAHGHDIIVFGRGSTNVDADSVGNSNVFVAGSQPSPITDVYFGSGINAATNLANSAFTLHGSRGNRFGSQNGADISIAGGIGYSAGNQGGNIRLKTSPTGAATTLLNRGIINPIAKTLTSGSPIDLIQIALASNTTAGGRLKWVIRATDGTDFQSLSGITTFAAVNKAGTITAPTPVNNTSNDTLAVSIGTLTTTWSAVSGVGTVNIQVSATSSLTTTTFDIQYQVENDSVVDISIL